MDTLSQFRTIEELVKMLDREKILLRDMFERRKSMTYRASLAMEVVDYKRERVRYLIDHGVIHENGDFLELEEVYIKFFEEVLDLNEEISVASVKEYIDSLKENIDYCLEENNEHRRFMYMGNVRKILRRIGLRTLKNIIDLKRNVDVAYKQEPNYKIKKARLVKLDEKRKSIKMLIQECERLMKKQVSFFRMASDPDMQRTCMDVHNDFTDADHNLLEIEKQIIDYINQIEQQNALRKKILQLKYLKDQLTWREDTNVQHMLESRNPIWMERRPYNKRLLSIDMLRSNEDLVDIIRKVAAKADIHRKSRTEAEPVSDDFLDDSVEKIASVNTDELWNSFRIQDSDLFSFIKGYHYNMPRDLHDHIVLYCQMATMHSSELHITDNYQTYKNIEYALIYAN